MAKTKLEKQAMAEAVAENITAVEEVKAEEKVEAKAGPSYEELAFLVQQLAGEVQALKSGKSAPATPVNNDLTSILTALTNRKSDREVSIVHNCELNGNLTTHIELSNATIDFTHVGETRLLSWQQFEEVSSKYRSFFDRNIILVGGDYAEVADQYGLPCASNKGRILSQKDMAKLNKLTVPELEKFVEDLSDEDKDTVFSYWLGKCYTREEGFYDRHKMDTLNRLSNGLFDNILLVMNGDGRKTPTANQK